MTDKQITLSKTTQDVPKMQTFKRLLSYITPYWWAILLSIVGFALSSSTQVGTAKLIEEVIEAISTGDQSRQNLLPILVIVFFVVRGVGSFLGSYYTALISRNLVYKLRIAVFDKLLKLPSKFYLQNSAGTISSKLIFDVEQVTAASTDSLKTLVKDGLTVIALLGYLLYLNWKLSLLLFVVLPPIFLLVRYASKRFSKLSKGIQESMGNVSHISNEVISGYQVVKNYGGQSYELDRFSKVSKKNLEQGLKMTVTSSINSPLVQLLLSFGLCAVMWIAFRPEVMSTTTAGEFVSYLVAAGLLSSPVQNLTNVNQKLQKVLQGQSRFLR